MGHGTQGALDRLTIRGLSTIFQHEKGPFEGIHALDRALRGGTRPTYTFIGLPPNHAVRQGKDVVFQVKPTRLLAGIALCHSSINQTGDQKGT